MIKRIVIILFIAAFCCSCAQSVAAPPPELLRPPSLEPDTAFVTRGDVSRFKHHRGLVRVTSESLSYGDIDLRFGEFFCKMGQRVEEGQLLCRLNIEALLEQIEERDREIIRLQTEYAFEDELLELDIAVAQAEIAVLFEAAAGYDESAMLALDEKRLDIERLRLQLAQTRERHALDMRYRREELDSLIGSTLDAEIRAPYGGVITYLNYKAQDAYIEPFEPLIYISDMSDVFIEYAGIISIGYGRNMRTVGYIYDHEYELEYRQLPQSDMLRYLYMGAGIISPIRFDVKNPDEALVPGAAVNIVIYDREEHDVLRIPANALNMDAELGNYVYVRENGSNIMRPVEVGLRSDPYIQITAGLEEGEVVVVK